MPRSIYNEGRVVGLSAYEAYVKQHLLEDPTSAPASEKEWLASSLAMGASMILKVPNVSASSSIELNFVDIYLPKSSRLGAANTIFASFFDGEAHFPEADSDDEFKQYWADRVTSYGQLIENDSTASPATGEVAPDGTIPNANLTVSNIQQMMDYAKILDGVVIQPGTWSETDSEDNPPEKDLAPNLYANEYPRVRLKIRGSIYTNPLVLLTGFTIRSVLIGTTNLMGSTNTEHPEDGDFLGPSTFPWATKIVFSVPSSLLSTIYQRTISDSRNIVVDDVAIIDMRKTNPGVFYNNYTDFRPRYTPNTANPRYPYTVDSVTVPSSVLTVFQKSNPYPPALYGTYVTATGDAYLNPLDVVAPGTVKMFYNDDGSEMAQYQAEFPGTWALNRTTDGKIQYIHNNSVVTIARSDDIRSTSLSIHGLSNTGDSITGDFVTPGGTLSNTNRPKLLRTYDTNGYSALSLMMSGDIVDSNHVPTRLTINNIPSSSFALTHSNSDDNLAWSSLMYGLSQNKSIDLLGDRLKDTKYTLKKPTTPTTSSWSPRNPNDNLTSNRWDTSKGASYIEFGNESDPKRLYILNLSDPLTMVEKEDLSTTVDPYEPTYLTVPDTGIDNGPNPANIPVGSIGIGWGWHGVYRLKDSSKYGHCWTPTYGAEYMSGSIAAFTGTRPIGHRIPFHFGLLIVSKHAISQAPSGFTPADVGKDHSFAINKSGFFDASDGIQGYLDGNNTLVVYINQYGGVHVISPAPTLQVSIGVHYTVNSELTADVTHIVIRNSEPNNYINYTIIGDIFKR